MRAGLRCANLHIIMQDRYWGLGNWGLGILLGIPLLCIGTLVFGHYYGLWRMDQVQRELFTLAEQLGYTPDALLQYRVQSRDFNIVFPWDTYCEAELFYTTPMDATEFAQQLRQVAPAMASNGRTVESSDVLYSSLKVILGEPLTRAAQANKRRMFMTHHYWSPPYDSSKSIELYETANMSVTLEYNGQDIHDNIVELYKLGGSFPIWVESPVKTIESAPPLSN